MAINFPASPTNGQKFTAGTVTYTYNSTAKVWNAGPLQTALPFNYLVNPCFGISQQNGVTAGTTSSYYVADQWHQAATLPQTVARIPSTVMSGPNGSKYSIRMIVTTPKVTLLATGEYTAFMQIVEGARMAPFQYGIASALPSVLRFWVSAPAGTYSAGVRSVGATPTNYRGCMTNYTISAGQAGAWVEVVIPIPGDTATGITTYYTTTANSLYVWFTFAASTGYQFASGAWATGNCIASTGMSNGIATTSATYYIADPGLYLDPANTGRPPPFKAIDDAEALIESQRYWYKAWCGGGTSTAATSVGRIGHQHPVTMRPTPQPIIAIVGAPTAHDIGANTAIVLGAGYSNYVQWEGNFTGATGWTIGRAAIMLGSTTAYVAVSGR